MTVITRHFATLDTYVTKDAPCEVGEKNTRQVHYRRAGTGPPLIMLHMSPRSSSECEPLMKAWADNFTIIAPDTPGYGASDPLAGEGPFDLSDFAHALASFADTIGINRFGLYGHHTGAMIAAEFAHLYPDRVTMTVANGYLVVTENERTEILSNYFHDYTPQPDGQHLAHIWRRIRDQFLFFPWSVQSQTGRERMKSKFTVPDPITIQEDVMDLLRTGRHESDGYGAAFRCDGIKILENIASPCLVTAQPYDLLYLHLDRIPKDIPDIVSVKPFDTLEILNAAAKKRLTEYAEGDTPPVTATATIRERSWRSYADTLSGQLCITRAHVGSGLPVILIHDLGSSASAWQSIATALTGKRPFIAFDLPGHGETGSAWGNDEVTINACAQAINEAIASLGIRSFHLISCGGGGLVALKLASDSNYDIRSWIAVDFWFFDDAEIIALENRLAPALAPQPYGEHLNKAWYAIRDSELFWPWFNPSPENALDKSPETEPARIHQRVCDLLKAAPVIQDLVNSALQVDTKTLLQSLNFPVTFCPRDGGPHTERCLRAAELTPNGKTTTLSSDSAFRTAAMVALLKD